MFMFGTRIHLVKPENGYRRHKVSNGHPLRARTRFCRGLSHTIVIISGIRKGVKAFLPIVHGAFDWGDPHSYVLILRNYYVA